MTKIPITLDDDQLMLAERQSALAGQTVAAFVQSVVDSRLPRKTDQRQAWDAYLRLAARLGTPEGPIPTREDLYAERIDKLVRGYERPDLRDRSAGFGEEGQSELVDGPPDRER